jgi:hypothetical protein
LAQVCLEEGSSGAVQQREKVLLSGPTADWWDAYVEAHGEPDSIHWPEFKATFHAQHIPQGVIKLKKKEFEDLK